MLDVTMLGGASFSMQGEVARCSFGPPGRLLACYLFEFPDRPHRREQLTDLFWGELEVSKARAALNTALWRIRKLLDSAQRHGGRSLLTIGNQVILASPSFVTVDTLVLKNASRLAHDLKGTPASESEERIMQAAVDAYAGPFLDGDDDGWILQERERLHSLFVMTALELMKVAARRGDHEQALDFGRRILAIDPLRESVQRQVMLLLVLNGQRADAIRAYQSLHTMLRADLGVEPMPDTIQLYEEIVSGEIFDRLGSYSAHQFEMRPS